MNTSETLVSDYGPGGATAINGARGAYYFALLTASPGTTDPGQFVFSGVYATNLSAAPGRIFGGTGVPVPGWQPGTPRSYLVCGWDASAGPTFHPSWLTSLRSIFGISAIATGIAGGFDIQTGESLPALDIFGSTGISSGFNLSVCLSCNPPMIMVQPRDQSASAGMNVQFVVSAALTPELIFQWFCNGSAISGATNSVLELSNVALSQNGNRYYVIVQNPWGLVASTDATLTVIAGAPLNVAWVPGLRISAEPATALDILTCDALSGSSSWPKLDAVLTVTNQQWWFDISGSKPERFYRTLTSPNAGSQPLLELHMVPAITLTGVIGSSVQVDYVNQFEMTNAGVQLATVLLTNSPQLYFDTSGIGQPPRIYWLITR